MQPADIAVELRPRSAWEAIDLGLAMLQRWWRVVLVPHAAVSATIVAVATLSGLWLDRAWVALVVVWWFKPLYDRVVLHVLSRAVFGELQDTRAVLRAAREWLGSGLPAYLLFRWWPDMARSFDLPVRQLEGSRGRAARERRGLLGRRTRNSAVWLTLVCMHFEAVVYWSLLHFATLLLPAKAQEASGFFEGLASGGGWAWPHLLAYSLTVLLLEPFYVAAGFALYLNRRTLLEGWDLEVALRRLAERHAALAGALLLGLGLVLMTPPAHAQKDPRKEIAEVLKAPEFPHQRETLHWQPRELPKPRLPDKLPDFTLAVRVARVVEGVVCALLAAALGFLLWQFYRALPRFAARPREAYRPPAALFGMQLAPESLPADVPAAASALAKEGKMREALALLYRGALSQLVHRRGVELLASHTEAEVLARAPAESTGYLTGLIEAWRACAYARRAPSADSVETLAQGYRGL